MFFFCWALILLNNETSYRIFPVLVLSGSVALLILTSKNNKLLNHNLFVGLGLVSYPLYLWHYPLIAFSNIFGISSGFLPFLLLVLSIFLGWLTYRYIEIKARKITNPFVLLIIAGLVVATGVLGGQIKNSGGLPGRLHIQQSLVQLKQTMRPPAADEGCNALIRQAGVSNRLFYYCRSTTHRINAQFIALIGDSHAQVLYTGLAEAFKKSNFDTLLLANTSCPSFLGGAMGKNEKDLKKCEDKIDQIYAVLKKIPSLKKVIIVARGPTYIDGKGFGDIERNFNQVMPKFKSFYMSKQAYSPSEEYFAGLERSIQFLEAKKAEIYIFLENPELGFSPVACVDRPYNIRGKACQVGYDIFLNRMKGYRASMQVLKRKYPNITLLDPSEFLCDASWCYAKLDGELLYADDDHLSVLGSKYISDKIIKRIIK